MATYDITWLWTALEFDTVNWQNISMIKYPWIDRIAIFRANGTATPYIQSFSVDTSTGTITAIWSRLDIWSMWVTTSWAELAWIDNSNLIINYNGSWSDWFLQLISVDWSGNCTLNWSALEYDTSKWIYNQVIMMDSTHALVVWADSTWDWRAQIFSVNTWAWTMTALWSSYEFDTSDYVIGDLVKLSSSKALVFYRWVAEDWWAIVLDINTSTRAVTAAWSAFEFKDAVTIGDFLSACVINDGNYDFVWIYDDAIANSVRARTFNINSSTRAISFWWSETTLVANAWTNTWHVVIKIDDTHVLAMYTWTDGDWFVTTLEMDWSWNLSKVWTEYEFDTLAFVDYWRSVVSFESNPWLFVIAWTWPASDWFIHTIQVEMPQTSNSSFLPFFL